MDSLTEGAIASGMKPYNALVNQVKRWLGKYASIEAAIDNTQIFRLDITGLAKYLHKVDFYVWLYGYHALFYDLGYTREELAQTSRLWYQLWLTHKLAEWKPIPPREAIKKFSKWKILEKDEFKKLDSYSKATTLTAARMTESTIQKGLRPALMSALKQGITLREFKKQVGGKGGKFMNNFHAETVFRTNVNKAYNQGHTEAMFHPAIDGLIPGVMFRAIMDMQTTDICMQRDGNVYSKEMISEYGIQPPCHFNCRSTLIPADAQDVEKKGFAMMPTEPASKGFGAFNKVGVKPPAIAPPITEPIPGIPTTKTSNEFLTDGFIDDVVDAGVLGKDLPVDALSIEDQNILISKEFLKNKEVIRMSGKLRQEADIEKSLKGLIKDKKYSDLGIKSIKTRQFTIPDNVLEHGKIIRRGDRVKVVDIEGFKGYISEFDLKKSKEYVVEYTNGDKLIYKSFGKSPDDSAFYSMLGQFEYISSKSVSVESVSGGLNNLRKLSGINLKAPTKLEQEFRYLMQSQHYRGLMPFDEGADLIKNINAGKVSLEDGISKIKKLYKDKMNIDVDLIPKAQYNPQGEYINGNKGHRVFKRFDMTDEELKSIDDLFLFHQIYEEDAGKWIGKILDSGTDGLISTVEKLRTGIPVKGMSPASDIGSGGGNYTFTRLSRGDRMHFGDNVLVFKKDALKRTDSINYYYDQFGAARPDVAKNSVKNLTNWGKRASPNNEITFKHGLSIKEIDFIQVRTKRQADEILSAFRKHGIEDIGGRPIEDLIRIFDQSYHGYVKDAPF